MPNWRFVSNSGNIAHGFLQCPTPYSACIREQRSGNIHLPIFSLPYGATPEKALPSFHICPGIPKHKTKKTHMIWKGRESKKGIDERDKKNKGETGETRAGICRFSRAKDLIRPSLPSQLLFAYRKIEKGK